MTDVLQVRVPEYMGAPLNNKAPRAIVVKKSDYIKDRKDIIARIDEEIKELKSRLDGIENLEEGNCEYVMKRLEKCYEIKRNCETSIALTQKQLDLESKSRTR